MLVDEVLKLALGLVEGGLEDGVLVDLSAQAIGQLTLLVQQAVPLFKLLFELFL